MNEANERDPFNNNCYGTLVDSRLQAGQAAGARRQRLQRAHHPRLRRRLRREGAAGRPVAGPLAGPGRHRHAARLQLHRPGNPGVHPGNCTGCMDCVTLCPDTAILGKVLGENGVRAASCRPIPEADREMFRKQWSKTTKYYDGRPRRSGEGGHVQDHHRPQQVQGLRRVRHRLRRPRAEDDPQDRRGHDRRSARAIASSSRSARRTTRYINDNLLIDMMLKEQTHVYVGGAGSCAGCGEGTALRMLCSATGAKYGDQWGIVAATGCNTVYTSTYPYNPYLVPWTNSLFENAPAIAMGVRMPLGPDGLGGQADLVHRRRRGDVRHRLPVAVAACSPRGMNIKVFVLDTQVYSNTGGQASTSSYTGQNTKMSVHGKAIAGKQERRKEIAQIAMMHPRTFVAQTTCAHINHFYRSGARRAGVRRPGDRLLLHHLPARARRGRQHGHRPGPPGGRYAGVPAVDLRSPQGRHDPRAAVAARQPGRQGRLVDQPQDRRGGRLHRLRRSEGRFAKHFDKDGNPSETLLRAKAGPAGELAPAAGVGRHAGQEEARGRQAGGARSAGSRAKVAAKPQAARPMAANGHRRRSRSAAASSTRTARRGSPAWSPRWSRRCWSWKTARRFAPR